MIKTPSQCRPKIQLKETKERCTNLILSIFCYFHSASVKSKVKIEMLHWWVWYTSIIEDFPLCLSCAFRYAATLHQLFKVGLHLPMLTRTVHNSVRGSQCKGKTATAFQHMFFSHVTATALYWESFFKFSIIFPSQVCISVCMWVSTLLSMYIICPGSSANTPSPQW